MLNRQMILGTNLIDGHLIILAQMRPIYSNKKAHVDKRTFRIRTAFFFPPRVGRYAILAVWIKKYFKN